MKRQTYAEYYQEYHRRKGEHPGVVWRLVSSRQAPIRLFLSHDCLSSVYLPNIAYGPADSCAARVAARLGVGATITSSGGNTTSDAMVARPIITAVNTP